VDIPSVFRLFNTGVQILVGEIRFLGVQRVDQFEFSSMFHLVDDGLKGLCHSGHGNRQDWFKGGYTCCMTVRWCCLDLQQLAGHIIQSLEQIPLSFFTDNAMKVVVCQNHPLFKGIPP